VRWEQRSFAPPASVAKERGTSSGPQLRRVRTGWWRKASRGPTRRGLTGAEGESGINVQGVIALEDLTLKSPPLEGVVLRYGQLYGPGTASDRPSNSAPIHVDAAAYAALLAIDHGDPGIYNIAQSNRHVATEKARADLGWNPDFRLPA
jgi:hypothetical protein